ncbi:MAG: 3-isopropylmalate dehydratase small subunit [Oscillospiraceae bacterium]|nr:3-isopropylmalate dehydratase small subunit [Oscillospiraceae bacterium]
MILQGTAHKYGDNIDTDVIIPARYLTNSVMEELVPYCMSDIDPEFAGRVKKCDVIVAGSNFGCGSSREHAPAVIKASGISAVVAESFARIFYRNSINIGLPILQSEEASRRIRTGDELKIDLEQGVIFNQTLNEEYAVEVFPPFIMEIIEKGGLMNYIAGKAQASAISQEEL